MVKTRNKNQIKPVTNKEASNPNNLTLILAIACVLSSIILIIGYNYLSDYLSHQQYAGMLVASWFVLTGGLILIPFIAPLLCSIWVFVRIVKTRKSTLAKKQRIMRWVSIICAIIGPLLPLFVGNLSNSIRSTINDQIAKNQLCSDFNMTKRRGKNTDVILIGYENTDQNNTALNRRNNFNKALVHNNIELQHFLEGSPYEKTETLSSILDFNQYNYIFKVDYKNYPTDTTLFTKSVQAKTFFNTNDNKLSIWLHWNRVDAKNEVYTYAIYLIPVEKKQLLDGVEVRVREDEEYRTCE